MDGTLCNEKKMTLCTIRSAPASSFQASQIILPQQGDASVGKVLGHSRLNEDRDCLKNLHLKPAASGPWGEAKQADTLQNLWDTPCISAAQDIEDWTCLEPHVGTGTGPIIAESSNRRSETAICAEAMPLSQCEKGASGRK
ncbi:unnamed protein product [Symbiodinium sp. CCMP2592]|nr:unnamed protein product [Symbiodinium sp. CCMP2592]